MPRQSLLQDAQKRAAIFTEIRDFFAKRAVCEVHTPALVPVVPFEPALTPIKTSPPLGSLGTGSAYYLRTSAESAMKRLLAKGLGAIYELAPVYRSGELGQWHRPEFYMLEWYRPHWDEYQLQAEVRDLLTIILGPATECEYRYKDLWQSHLGINPHQASIASLKQKMQEHQINAAALNTRLDYVQLLYSHIIEPQLKTLDWVWVWGYPVEETPQAATHIDEDGDTVAVRFELYVHGVELVNANRELCDAEELQRRWRQAAPNEPLIKGIKGIKGMKGMNGMEGMDEGLLEAMRQGLPPCCGAALGVDRLLALSLGYDGITDILPNAWQN